MTTSTLPGGGTPSYVPPSHTLPARARNAFATIPTRYLPSSRAVSYAPGTLAHTLTRSVRPMPTPVPVRPLYRVPGPAKYPVSP